MTSSSPPAVTQPRRREPSRPGDAPRRNHGESTALRSALVYVLAAGVAVVAAELVIGRTAAPAAQPPQPPARAAARRAGTSGDDGFSTPPPPVPQYVPAAPGAAPRDPAPAEEPAEARQDEPAIPPDAWKPPPPPNPDPSLRPAIHDVWPNKGPAEGGETVQIRGRNLQPALVLFGRSPARILSVRESDGDVVLTLVAPPLTGPLRTWITVTNRDGSNAVPAEPFEYYR